MSQTIVYVMEHYVFMVRPYVYYSFLSGVKVTIFGHHEFMEFDCTRCVICKVVIEMRRLTIVLNVFRNKKGPTPLVHSNILVVFYCF